MHVAIGTARMLMKEMNERKCIEGLESFID